MVRKVLIVGAGIVGSAIADRLQAEGCAVTVFEGDIPAGGATGAGFGGVVVFDDSPAQLQLTSWSRRRWQAEDLPPSCERVVTGIIWVATQEDEKPELEAKVERYASAGVETELLDSAQLARREPLLRPGLPGGLLVPGDISLYQVGASRFLLGRAIERGASLRREKVRELIPGGVRTDQGLYHGDAVVLAAGVGVTELLPELPVRPRKGHVAITERMPGLFKNYINELGYLTSAHGRSDASVALTIQPRATGQMLIGSSREFVGLDPAVSREVLAAMLKRATWFMPCLAKVPIIRAWTGFRPCGDSNVPTVGPWPGREGLFVAAGHEGLGITMATGTAELITHHVTGIPTVLDPLPFLPKIGELSHV